MSGSISRSEYGDSRPERKVSRTIVPIRRAGANVNGWTRDAGAKQTAIALRPYFRRHFAWKQGRGSARLQRLSRPAAFPVHAMGGVFRGGEGESCRFQEVES